MFCWYIVLTVFDKHFQTVEQNGIFTNVLLYSTSCLVWNYIQWVSTRQMSSLELFVLRDVSTSICCQKKSYIIGWFYLRNVNITFKEIRSEMLIWRNANVMIRFSLVGLYFPICGLCLRCPKLPIVSTLLYVGGVLKSYWNFQAFNSLL